MMMNYITYLFIISAPTSILLWIKAEALSPEKILGGDEALKGKFMYQVSVQANGTHVCGGSIIDDMLIATVAHCLINKTEARFLKRHFNVVATRNVLYRNQTIASAEVEKVYFLKKFDMMSFSTKTIFESEEELIILKLRERLGIASNPQLKKLNTPRVYAFQFWTNLVITGYGVHNLSDNGRFLSIDGKLRYAYANVTTYFDCGISHNATIKSFHLCARVKQVSEQIRGVCSGDSGSPLVKDDELIIGVLVGASSLCSERERPGVYMRTAHYSKFIDDAKRGKISDMHVFSQIKNASSGYTGTTVSHQFKKKPSFNFSSSFIKFILKVYSCKYTYETSDGVTRLICACLHY